MVCLCGMHVGMEGREWEREQRFSEEGKKHVRNIPCFHILQRCKFNFCKKKKEYSFYTIPFVTKGVSFRIFQHRSCILWRQTFLRLVRKPFFCVFFRSGDFNKKNGTFTQQPYLVYFETQIFSQKKYQGHASLVISSGFSCLEFM